ncbi:MAG: VIT family protein [Cellvibrio sp.]|jgi:VIT1/CCC1 family predicted Fe2+/Mn2+ transporter|nr:VIT family protein [Cellvibrio sp.]
MPSRDQHFYHRSGWLRAAVLGANDGIISTASLMMGIAVANQTQSTILLAGIAGLVAGAISMAAGEYVSVCSQMDLENADLEREKIELIDNPESELRELEEIYIARGVSRDLSKKIAAELTQRDALGAHARDELGITDFNTAKPLQAAVASAISFSLGAAIPLLIAITLVAENLWTLPFFSLLALALLGALSAKIGGARPIKGAVRVTFWGAAAMAATSLVGSFFGIAV